MHVINQSPLRAFAPEEKRHPCTCNKLSGFVSTLPNRVPGPSLLQQPAASADSTPSKGARASWWSRLRGDCRCW